MTILLTYATLFLVASFLGWLGTRVLYVLHNRSTPRQHYLGYLPLQYEFGLGILMATILHDLLPAGWFWLYIALVVPIALAFEYLYGYLQEKFLRMRTWDYSLAKYHINGRICLSFGLFFTLCLSVYWFVYLQIRDIIIGFVSRYELLVSSVFAIIFVAIILNFILVWKKRRAKM
jgi:uncharacterized membrane protein